jgi:molecular chaperone DnaK
MDTPLPGTSPRTRKTVGIDLGTTNSVIALLSPTDSDLIPGRDDQGHMTFPSLVGYHPEQRRLVAGRAAQALQGPEPRLTLPLSSVKRFMGLDKAFPVGPEALTPPQASACILRLLRDMLARTLADPRQLLDSAVLTMPAYFNHNQIEATRQAGELAGFEVVELLHEPTAAAIYYSWLHDHGDASYLVYDLGGGTFDVSLIRRRLGDYEVLSVSGDPFLGGDDFDRLLASHLLEAGTWTWQPEGDARPQLAALFDLATPAGAGHFARLVQLAEGIKCELTGAAHAERYVPQVLRGEDGRALALEARVERATFDRLIKDKVDRTIDCCHEALARARERAGLRLTDVDHVVLVGGSSRVPLVRDTVRAAFGNPDLAEHVRNLEPLLHEPDLCVAFGAALRAGTHGTRYLFRMTNDQFPMTNSQCPMTNDQAEARGGELELHLTSPASARDTRYQATGVVRYRRRTLPESERHAARPGELDIGHWSLDIGHSLEGGSVRVRSLATGLAEEAFLDERGTFAQELELQPETDNALEWAVCDGVGAELARVVTAVRHQGAGRPLGQAVLPTQLITKPLQIEVLTPGRQRVKQAVAPVGATLPGVFRCTCRTQDQAGRVVVPIYEENRVVKQMVLDGLRPDLPLGSPVEIEFHIDVKHNIEVRLRLRQADGSERSETATLEAPPPPKRPTRAEIDEAHNQIEALLPHFAGAFRARAKARAAQLRQDLLEALSYEDEPKAIQRMAELRELLEHLQTSRGLVLDPPWPRFAQLVRHCLDLAAGVADGTGRDRAELFEHVHAQERYAEQAYEEHNQALYRECRENLEKYAGYLNQLLRDALPRPPARPARVPEEEARAEVEQFRSFLSSVWKKAKAAGRADLDARLTEIAGQARGLTQRVKAEPHAAFRDAHRLGTEVEKIANQLDEGRRQIFGDDAGLLEGSA